MQLNIMDKEKQNIKFRIVASVVTTFIFAILIGWIILRIFFWDETFGWVESLTGQYPLLLYSLFTIVCGILSISIFRDIERGEEQGIFAMLRLICCAGGAIYCGVNFLMKIKEKF